MRSGYPVQPETDIQRMLAQLKPSLIPGEYVFCSLPQSEFCALAPETVLGSFREAEGVTVLLEKTHADARGLSYDGVFAGITLGVYSSLAAVGLTAAVASALAERDIPANVIAAYHHDHVFVPAALRDQALDALAVLGTES